MSRYRFSNARTEETAEILGDQSFSGLVQKTTDPSQLTAGQLRVVENGRIENGVLGTRDGVVACTNLNPISYGKIYGRGLFADPNSFRWMLLAVAGGVWAVADGSPRHFIGLPAGTIITAPCELVTAFSVVLLFRGPDLPPLYWDGVFGDAFTTPPAPLDVTKVTIPNAITAEFVADRLIVPNLKDSINVSDIGDYTSFSLNYSGFQINQGEADNLVRVFPWMNQSVVLFKSKSIYLAQNVTGDLSSLSLTQVVDGVGLVGRKAVVMVGNEIFYMDRGGVNKISQIFEDTPETRALPISDPIKPTMDNINWQYASGIVAAWRRERVYFAVPLGQSTFNNALLVWNIPNEAWESIDTFTNTDFSMDDIVTMDYNGDRRLVAIDFAAGQLLLLEEGSQDSFNLISPPEYIQFRVVTRGYIGDSKRSSYRRLGVSLATWNPNFSVNVSMDGVARKFSLASNVTKSNIEYYTFDKKNWNPSNVNDDWDTAGRMDYSVNTSIPLFLKEGIVVDQMQETWENYVIDRPGKYCELEIINIQGRIEVRGIVFEGYESQRADRTQN